MVVGETGAGKTSLLSNLFHRKLDWPIGTRTEAIKELQLHLQLHGKGAESSVPFEAQLFASYTYYDSTYYEFPDYEPAPHVGAAGRLSWLGRPDEPRALLRPGME